MSLILLLIAVAYLLPGLWLATQGAMGEDIRKEAAGRCLLVAGHLMARTGRSVPFWWRDLFIASLFVTAVVSWPVALYCRRRERKCSERFSAAMKSPEDSMTPSPKPAPERRLMWGRLGGAGCLVCRDCKYHAGIVSFIHGHGSSNGWRKTGYQCRACHQLHALESTNDEPANLTCPCGGELSRDEPLLCPRCHGFNVYYDCALIT